MGDSPSADPLMAADGGGTDDGRGGTHRTMVSKDGLTDALVDVTDHKIDPVGDRPPGQQSRWLASDRPERKEFLAPSASTSPEPVPATTPNQWLRQSRAAAHGNNSQ